MAINKNLKAWIRFDGSGRVVPSSLILQRNKPKVGNWKEIPANECCNYNPIPVPTGCNSFWINQTFNPESENTLYAVGSAIDSNCNTFMFMEDSSSNPNNPNESSSTHFLLQKFNDAGDLVWNRVFDYEENGTPTYTNQLAQSIFIDKEDNIYCFILSFQSPLFRTAIVKFDNDGNQLWFNILLLEESELISSEQVLSVAFDGNNNMYASFKSRFDSYSPSQNMLIKKISPNGVVLESKLMLSSENPGNCFESFLTVNSAGEVYLTGWIDETVDKVHVIKLDSSLNEIWHKSFSAPFFIFPYGIALDKDENIVFTVGYGASSTSLDPLFGTYIKMSPAGDIIWTTKISNTIDPDFCLSTFQLTSDADGNVYFSSTFPSTVPGYSANPSNLVIIGKLLPDGSLEWVYGIEGPNPIYSNYLSCPIAGNIANNSLVLAYYDDVDPYNAQLFKLPLTLLPNGTYGGYTITDITSLWTTSSPTIVLSSDTLNYQDTLKTTTPLTYITFEGTYTTLHTPL